MHNFGQTELKCQNRILLLYPEREIFITFLFNFHKGLNGFSSFSMLPKQKEVFYLPDILTVLKNYLHHMILAILDLV